MSKCDFLWIRWSPRTDTGRPWTSGRDNSWAWKHMGVSAVARIPRLAPSAAPFCWLCVLIRLFTWAEIYDTVSKWEHVVSSALCSLSPATRCSFPRAAFLKNNFCLSYLMDGRFVGIISTLCSVAFVLLELEEEIVRWHFQQLVRWPRIEYYRITLILRPVNQLSEMNDGKVAFVFKFSSWWHRKCS